MSSTASGDSAKGFPGGVKEILDILDSRNGLLAVLLADETSEVADKVATVTSYLQAQNDTARRELAETQIKLLENRMELLLAQLQTNFPAAYAVLIVQAIITDPMIRDALLVYWANQEAGASSGDTEKHLAIGPRNPIKVLSLEARNSTPYEEIVDAEVVEEP